MNRADRRRQDRNIRLRIKQDGDYHFAKLLLRLTTGDVARRAVKEGVIAVSDVPRMRMRLAWMSDARSYLETWQVCAAEIRMDPDCEPPAATAPQWERFRRKFAPTMTLEEFGSCCRRVTSARAGEMFERLKEMA